MGAIGGLSAKKFANPPNLLLEQLGLVGPGYKESPTALRAVGESRANLGGLCPGARPRRLGTARSGCGPPLADPGSVQGELDLGGSSAGAIRAGP